MTSRDFCFWLQGFFEVADQKELNEKQVSIIKNHLNLVFKHEIDPSLNEGKSNEEIQELNNVHNGTTQSPDYNNIILRC